MKIMTWNVNQLLGNNDWSKLPEVIKPKLKQEYMKKISKYIESNYVKKDFEIMALQEFPFGSEEEYNKWISDFRYEGYEPFLPVNVSGPFTTIVLAKKDWKYVKKEFSFLNRVVIVEKDGCSVACVHIPDLERRPDAESLWREISVLSTEIIMGDFNTDDESTKQFRDYFNKLECEELKGIARRKRQGIPPTCVMKTHIDYILLNKRDNKSIFEYEIDTTAAKLELSDHFPVYAKIDI